MDSYLHRTHPYLRGAAGKPTIRLTHADAYTGPMHMTHNCATCPREPTTTGYMYVLSSDCVYFMVKNRQALRPLAHLDDITIGLWMLAMQVHARIWSYNGSHT